MKKSIVLIFVFAMLSIILSVSIVQAKGKPGGSGDPPILVPIGTAILDGIFDEWESCQPIPLYLGGKTFKDIIAETCFMSDGKVLYVAGWPVEGNQINLKVESIHLKVGKRQVLENSLDYPPDGTLPDMFVKLNDPQPAGYLHPVSDYGFEAAVEIESGWDVIKITEHQSIFIDSIPDALFSGQSARTNGVELDLP